MATIFALRPSRSLRHLFLATVLACVTTRAGAATTVPMTLGDMVRDSGTIVVASVASANARWLDATRRVIVTDCRIDVEDTILGTPGASATLTFWGGTLGGETQYIAGMPVPAVGERFVMFLRPRAFSGEVAPTVGLFQGLLRIVRDPASGGDVLLEAEGGALRPSIVALASGTTRLDAFVAALRAHLPELRATPVSPAIRAVFSATPDPSLPKMRAAERIAGPGAFVPASVPSKAPVSIEASDDGPAAPGSAIVRGERAEIAPGRAATRQGPTTVPGGFSWVDGVSALPIVINQLPDSFTPWAPIDQYMLSYWNYYSDVFRVRVTSSGTYLWGDGVFDFGGFLNSAEVSYMYGTTWEAMGNFIGVTFVREYNNRIVEADVMLRASVSWTTNDEAVYAGTTTAMSYRATLFHEFGHTWGARHYNGDLAQMGYSYRAEDRGFSLPYTDDAEGIRTLYPAIARSDLAVHLYRWLGTTVSNGATFWTSLEAGFPSAAAAGTAFRITDFTVTNAGTQTITTPTIEWYLTAQRNFTGAYYYLGSSQYPSLARFTKFTETTIFATANIPSTVPPGSYYLAAFIRNDSGPSSGAFPYSNNMGFTRRRMTVTQSCATSIATTAVAVKGGSGSGSVSVSDSPGCAWSATSNASWIAIASATGSGSGSVTYQVAANPAGAARVGTLTIGGRTLTVTQAAGVATRMSLDRPVAGATIASPFVVSGWAINESAWSGTGVDAVHVYAYGVSGGITFLGASSYGGSRPDVGAVFGTQYDGSGFTLTASLPAGDYVLVAYAHNLSSGSFDFTRSAPVTVTPPVSRPSIAVDAPVPNAVLTSAFEVGGWAIDEGAGSGTGIDAVQFYVQPAGASAPGVFIGSGSYGTPRPDVGAIYGPRFANSGFHFTITGLGPGPAVLGVYAHSTVTGAYSVVRTVPFTVNPNQLMSVDVPSPEGTVTTPSFLVAGWAIDRATAAGSGVDALHVYAYPNPGSGAPPIFLGIAEVGYARSDVAAIYGARYANSGYALIVVRAAAGLTPGVYNIVVHAHSVSGAFNNLATVRVTLQ